MKRVMKLTETLGIIKVVGTGTHTILLNSDLLSPTQILSGPLGVGIAFITWSTGGNIAISRNAENLYELFTNEGNFDFSGNGGYSDMTHAGSDINITITNGGTCILTLRKATGYVSRIEPFRFGQYDDPTQVGA